MLLVLVLTGTIAFYAIRTNYIRDTDRSLTVKGMETIYSAASSEFLNRSGRFLHPPLSSADLIKRLQPQFNTDSSNPVGDPIYMRLFQSKEVKLVLISHDVKMHDLVQRTLGTRYGLPTGQAVQEYFVGRNEFDELRVVDIRIPRQPFVLQLATPWQRYEDTLSSIVFGIAEIIIFGFFLSALGGWILVTRTLRPITEIVTEASKMSGNRLEPAFVAARTSTDDEIGHLVNALNAMMGRVHKAIISQRQFTADASHDLKTPLAILRGEMELALTRERSSEDYRRVLKSGLEETERLIRIVSDLRELARAEFEGENPMHRTSIDMVKLSAGILESRRRQAKSLGLSVNFQSDWQIITISADSSAIERAIANLVDNAISYNKSGGIISVTVRQDAGFGIVDVTDSGIGIGDADCEHIFDRFFRGDKSRSSNAINSTSNTGLGLAIVKSIVTSHGGSVTVQSKLDQGSTFTIMIPLLDSNAL